MWGARYFGARYFGARYFGGGGVGGAVSLAQAVYARLLGAGVGTVHRNAAPPKTLAPYAVYRLANATARYGSEDLHRTTAISLTLVGASDEALDALEGSARAAIEGADLVTRPAALVGLWLRSIASGPAEYPPPRDSGLTGLRQRVLMYQVLQEEDR